MNFFFGNNEGDQAAEEQESSHNLEVHIDQDDVSAATNHTGVQTTRLISSSTLSQINLNNSESHPTDFALALGALPEDNVDNLRGSEAGNTSQTRSGSPENNGMKDDEEDMKKKPSMFQLRSRLKHVGNVLIDYVPMLGHHSTHKGRSIKKDPQRAIDTVVKEELERHPLHRACADSAASVLASSRTMGSDIDTIKSLVEEDPSLLSSQLPTSRDTPLHIAVRFGVEQWRQQQNFNGGVGNLPIIAYLIKAEIDYYRKQAILEMKENGDRSPISMGSLVSKTALYASNSSMELPIHNAVETGYEGAAKAMLRHDKEAEFDTIVMADADGNLPIHLAVLNDDLFMVKLLLQADYKRQAFLQEKAGAKFGVAYRKKMQKKWRKSDTVFVKNNNDEIPLHLALTSIHKFEMWGALLEADTKKETLHIDDANGHHAMEVFLTMQRACEDEQEFVDIHLAKPLLERLLSGKRLPDWDDHLKRSVAKSQKMQLAMNEKAASRLPFLIFNADFYAQIISVGIMYYSTHHYLYNDMESWYEKHFGVSLKDWVMYCTLGLAIYFFAREFVQFLLSKDLYWTDPWNYIDLVRIALLLCIYLMINGKFIIIGDEYIEGEEELIRRLFLTTAVFIYFGIISFLRMTYLPFALFVGGSTQVVITLIPFLVTFFMALALFAYGYWIGGFTSEVSQTEQDFAAWLIETFIATFSGSDNLVEMEPGYISNLAWTTLFTILMNVLLLNVLIAVITSAWEEITEYQTEVFWGYRIEYASGVLPIERSFRKIMKFTYLSCCFDYLVAQIEYLNDMPIKDRVNWEIQPYSEVVNDPSLYWDKDRLARLLLGDPKLAGRREQVATSPVGQDSASLVDEQDPKKSIGFKLNEENVESLRSFEADWRFSRTHCNHHWVHRFWIAIRFSLFCVAWAFSLLFGFLTLGLLWPKCIRAALCAPSTTGEGEGQESSYVYDASAVNVPDDFLEPSSSTSAAAQNLSKQQQQAALEKKLEDMKSTIDALKATVENLVKMQALTHVQEDENERDGSEDGVQPTSSWHVDSIQ